jgi:hypothetical protein
VSVDFYPEISDADVVTYEVWCDASERLLASPKTYAAARSLANLHGDQCEHCAGYGGRIEKITDIPSVNVSSNNAALLLRLLNLELADLTGSCAAEDFLTRVQHARANPGYDRESISYVLHRLEQLQGVTEWCRSNGRQVCWA